MYLLQLGSILLLKFSSFFSICIFYSHFLPFTMDQLCVTCGITCKSKKALTMHTNNVHDIKEHPCDVCGKILIGRKKFLNHKDSHATIECNLCEKSIPKIPDQPINVEN